MKGFEGMWAFKALMAVAVLGCIAASAIFAFEFGWTRGATEVHRWTYALAGVALDLLKAGLPIFGALASRATSLMSSLGRWIGTVSSFRKAKNLRSMTSIIALRWGV